MDMQLGMKNKLTGSCPNSKANWPDTMSVEEMARLVHFHKLMQTLRPRKIYVHMIEDGHPDHELTSCSGLSPFVRRLNTERQSMALLENSCLRRFRVDSEIIGYWLRET